ncbi:MAG: 23S rRNA (adenine(2503)-C(2))-methyltransferase RlmN [Treponema sp.]|nr:23S rRNA (adenine(2503)-C(2))-methyltransferase RlmN [Treponema sp.]
MTEIETDVLPLTGLSLPELEKILCEKTALLSAPLERFRARQIYNWISRGIAGFDQMTDLPAAARAQLKERFSLYSCSVDSCNEDTNASGRRAAKKIVVTLKDFLQAEAVLLDDGKDRRTACLSTQAGCPCGCVYCKTGSLGFSRNLTCGEIVEQFLFLGGTQNIDNIVIMGMGEPLLNLPNLRKAVSIFTDPQGVNFSRRRITVSTCGICAGLSDIAQNDPYIRLALSLTTADEELRRALMPVSAANPLQKIKEALVLFQSNGGSRVTLEIPLLGGVNTREKDAKETAAFAEGLHTVINIIPWNPVAGLLFRGKPLREPEKKETENFIKALECYGLKVTMRRRKGQRIMGACGQLGCVNLLSEKPGKSNLEQAD